MLLFWNYLVKDCINIIQEAVEDMQLRHVQDLKPSLILTGCMLMQYHSVTAIFHVGAMFFFFFFSRYKFHYKFGIKCANEIKALSKSYMCKRWVTYILGHRHANSKQVWVKKPWWKKRRAGWTADWSRREVSRPKVLQRELGFLCWVGFQLE